MCGYEANGRWGERVGSCVGTRLMGEGERVGSCVGTRLMAAGVREWARVGKRAGARHTSGECTCYFLASSYTHLTRPEVTQ